MKNKKLPTVWDITAYTLPNPVILPNINCGI